MKSKICLCLFLMALLIFDVILLKKGKLRQKASFNHIFSKESNNVIKILYEPLCPDSINFFNYSFKYFYQKRNNFFSNNLIDKIIILPGARTKLSYNKQTNTYSFDCIHGNNEYIANKFHSCAFYLLDIEKYSEYIFCYMSNILSRNFSYDNYKLTRYCAENLQFDYNNLEQCVVNNGDSYLMEIIKRNDLLPQKVENAPWILVNDEYEKNMEEQVENNMLDFMCKLFQTNKAPVC